MSRARGRQATLALMTALALAACQAPGGPKLGANGGAGAGPKVKASAKPQPGAVRVLGAQDVLVAAQLIGKVKLISDRGAGLISNNSGSVISDAGAGLISDKGLGLISNNSGSLVSNNSAGVISDAGAGLIGKTKYRAMQVEGLREALLADAEIEVLDGAGRPLVDAKGPIRIKADATGAYRFEGKLPAENLVLRVKVHAGGALPGGELRALVPNPGGAEIAAELDLDTPATLGATYVLDKFVKNEPGVYAKLPAREVDNLKREMGAALRTADQAPAYEGGAIVAAVDELAARVAPLKTTLDRIESILLLGQKGLGSGQKATEVPLTMPVAVAADVNGDLLVAEAFVGRIRRVKADQTVALYAAPASASELGYALPGMQAMRRGPDGALYAVVESARQVVRIVAGKPVAVAGNGRGGHGPAGGQATETMINPLAIAWGPDGTLYVSEGQAEANARARVLAVKDGLITEVPTPGADFGSGDIVGLEVGPDGTIYTAHYDLVTDEATGQRVSAGRIGRLKPGGAWEFFHRGLLLAEDADLLLTPEGLLLAEDDGHRIWRLALADLAKTPVAGTGRAGHLGDGGPAPDAQLSQPTGLYRAADGRITFADRGNALVRSIAPDGTIATVAGLRGVFRQGAGAALAVNNPFGLALDPDGHLLIAEGGGHVVRRFDGTSLTAVVGGERGFGGDGGPAAGGLLNTPYSLASRDGTLYIADLGNERIRRVGPDGLLATLVGVSPTAAGKRYPDGPLLPPDVSLEHPAGLAIGPDGLLAFCDQGRHQVFKLRADGQVALIAGPTLAEDKKMSGDAGDGGKAVDAYFSGPTSLAYDGAGNLYVSDVGNCRIRRIDPQGGIDTFAGVGVAGLLTGAAPPEGLTAKDVAFALPISVAVDPQGNVFVGELGTRNFKAYGFDGATSELAKLLPEMPARIRKITPDGRVSIVAGPGGRVLTDPASDEALVLPIAMLVKPDGALVVADPGTNQVRLIPKEAIP